MLNFKKLGVSQYDRNSGSVQVEMDVRSSYYGDKQRKTMTFKDAYDATVWANSFSCKDARFKPDIKNVTIGRGRRGC